MDMQTTYHVNKGADNPLPALGRPMMRPVSAVAPNASRRSLHSARRSLSPVTKVVIYMIPTFWWVRAGGATARHCQRCLKSAKVSWSRPHISLRHSLRLSRDLDRETCCDLDSPPRRSASCSMPIYDRARPAVELAIHVLDLPQHAGSRAACWISMSVVFPRW